ncbi:MAG TPA: CapA family protein [Fibrobacteria bacterium]|nr:CapA family protein [Fibrobacteria bacterium]HOX50030.1 CapA family protein [Fibrobacteria bacterium]
MILFHLLVVVPALRIAVFGDAQFDRGVRSVLRGRDPSFLLDSTRSIRDGADVSIVNLESPLCEASTAPAAKGGIRLRSDPAAAVSLARSGFSVATLANNHVLDRQAAGLSATLRALDQAGVRSVGADTAGRPCRPLVVGKGPDSVAIFAWTPLGGIDARKVCTDADRVLSGIRDSKARRIPSLVVTHWGIEGSPLASASQTAAAARFARAGALAVVGHHAHVVQSDGGSIPSAVGGMPVWHGIGNYVFDQWDPWSRPALAVVLEISGQELISHRTVELVRDGPRVRIKR